MKQLICTLLLAAIVLFSSQFVLFAGNLTVSEPSGISKVEGEDPPKPKKKNGPKKSKFAKKKKFGKKKVGAKKRAYTKKYVVPIYAKF